MPDPAELATRLNWIEPALIVLLFVATAVVVYLGVRVRRLLRTNEAFIKEKKTVYSFLNRIGEQMITKLDLDETLREIVAYLVDSTRAQAGAVFLMDDEHTTLRARVLVGVFPPFRKTIDYAMTKTKFLHERMKRERIPVGEGVLGEVAATAEPLLIAEARDDPRIVQHPGLEIDTLMATPLIVQGRVEGVFALVNRAGNQPFTETDLSVMRALAEQASVTIQTVRLFDAIAEQQRIEQELRVATDFQRLLLPDACPRLPGVEIAAASRPALEVGGDFYDFFPLGPDRIGIVIADVSGKGIPGALIMSMARSVVRAESAHAGSPRAVLERVNHIVFHDTREHVFITMIFAILDRKARTIAMARAGHEPLIAYSSNGGGMRLLAPEGIALGLVDTETFSVIRDQEIPLRDGDLFVFYTDGIVEARNTGAEEYGQERFLESIRTHADEPPQRMIETLVGDVQRFCREGRQADDITLVVVKINRLAEEAESESRQGQEGNIETV